MVKQFKLPNLGENIEGGEVVSVLVKEGEFVELDQNVIELETDKAVVEVPIDFAGKVTQLKVSVGDKVRIGDILFSLDDQGDTHEISHQLIEENQNKNDHENEKVRIKEEEDQNVEGVKYQKSSPSIRRKAYEKGIDLDQVQPTGRRGRILSEDLKKSNFSLDDISDVGRIESLSNLRLKIANRMQESWLNIPQVTQFEEANLERLLDLKKKLSQSKKVSFSAILLKVLSEVLLKHEKFRANLLIEEEKVIYFEEINIGLAVDTDYGLVVPVVKNIERKCINEISEELEDLTARARTRKLKLEELRGGVFTLSNLGGLATTYFTPIIFPPQTAILGIGRSIKTENKKMMPLSLTYDHRLIDGADAARFLKSLIEVIENPESMN